MDWVLRDTRSGKLVKSLDSGNKVHSNHIGNAVRFPTSDEAVYYIKDNGCDWSDFIIEFAG